jgi:hypothetical protein
MDFIAGAKILAERFGDTEPVGIDQAGDTRPLFHWCGVSPDQSKLEAVVPGPLTELEEL